jgi:hypothetical protein
MQQERDKTRNDQQQENQTRQDQHEKQRSSAFKESSRGDKKSTTNVEEEAGLEQERKDAMSERD